MMQNGVKFKAIRRFHVTMADRVPRFFFPAKIGRKVEQNMEYYDDHCENEKQSTKAEI
jgi:hypothetical protein